MFLCPFIKMNCVFGCLKKTVRIKKTHTMYTTIKPILYTAIKRNRIWLKCLHRYIIHGQETTGNSILKIRAIIHLYWKRFPCRINKRHCYQIPILRKILILWKKQPDVWFFQSFRSLSPLFIYRCIYQFGTGKNLYLQIPDPVSSFFRFNAYVWCLLSCVCVLRKSEIAMAVYWYSYRLFFLLLPFCLRFLLAFSLFWSCFLFRGFPHNANSLG